jgi:hypothetical protein
LRPMAGLTASRDKIATGGALASHQDSWCVPAVYKFTEPARWPAMLADYAG